MGLSRKLAAREENISVLDCTSSKSHFMAFWEVYPS